MLQIICENDEYANYFAICESEYSQQTLDALIWLLINRVRNCISIIDSPIVLVF